jgi:hypothetical protein
VWGSLLNKNIWSCHYGGQLFPVQVLLSLNKNNIKRVMLHWLVAMSHLERWK